MIETACLIPAFRPDADLLILVSGLLKNSGSVPIVVVDDGSGPEFQPTFATLQETPGVVVLRHAINLGKGAALKLGINWLLVRYDELKGVITADADGQHSIDDIARVRARFLETPETLVMGARQFGHEVPFRSRFGNNISKIIYRFLLGLRLTDTQTGLRAIPRRLAENCLAIRANRYEFETEQLALAAKLGTVVSEVPIETIYKNGNAASHFSPFFDSARIYFVVLRYAMSSFATTILDFVVFVTANLAGLGTFGANLTARAIALVFQFYLLASFVFHSPGTGLRFIFFCFYVMTTGVVSATVQQNLMETLHINFVFSKLIVETLIFTFNFLMLRDFVFARGRR